MRVLAYLPGAVRDFAVLRRGYLAVVQSHELSMNVFKLIDGYIPKMFGEGEEVSAERGEKASIVRWDEVEWGGKRIRMTEALWSYSNDKLMVVLTPTSIVALKDGEILWEEARKGIGKGAEMDYKRMEVMYIDGGMIVKRPWLGGEPEVLIKSDKEIFDFVFDKKNNVIIALEGREERARVRFYSYPDGEPLISYNLGAVNLKGASRPHLAKHSGLRALVVPSPTGLKVVTPKGVLLLPLPGASAVSEQHKGRLLVGTEDGKVIEIKARSLFKRSKLLPVVSP